MTIDFSQFEEKTRFEKSERVFFFLKTFLKNKSNNRVTFSALSV